MAIALGVLLVGCVALLLLARAVQQWWAPSDYTWRRLDRLPEAHLYHPECMRTGRSGENASKDIGGYHPARVEFGCETTVDEETLRGWYRSELTARGWQYDDTGFGSEGTRWDEWRKGDLRFQLVKFPDPGSRWEQTPGAVHRYKLVLRAEEPTR